MSTLCVRLLGKFRVQCDEQILEGFDVRKVQELFCYLLCYRDRPHPREALANLLWGECSTTQSKTYLRKALWQLQNALESYAARGDGRLVLVEPDWIQLNSEANLWLDVAVVEHAFALVQGVPGEKIDGQYFQILGDAVDLYDGNLLEGWYQDWCLYERERLQQMYMAMLDKLMAYCEAHYEYETGLTYGARVLRYDRAREHTHRRMMRLHYLAGDRTEALRQYERCLTALKDELGVGPTETTLAFYAQIRASQLDEAAPLHVAPEAAAALPEVLGRLRQIEVVLADVQRQVQQDIRAVEQALNQPRS